MKSIQAVFAAALVSMAQVGYAQAAPLTTADQCTIDAYNDIFRDAAQTKDVVEIEIAPIQKKCEETTGTKVQHPDLLKKGLSNFSAGGTRFLFK